MDLTLDTLACGRGGRAVVADVATTVAQGRALILRGPNGSGKSTLIRTLAGLLPPLGGDARLGSLSLSQSPGDWREAVAFVGHQDGVKPALSVAQNLMLWARILGGDAGRAEGALARLGLGPLAEAPAGVLSAGNRRRLGLARLLVTARPLWLLDEPTVSLDAASTALVAEMIAEHCAGGGLVVAATHIEMGLSAAETLDIAEFRPKAQAPDVFEGEAW